MRKKQKEATPTLAPERGGMDGKKNPVVGRALEREMAREAQRGRDGAGVCEGVVGEGPGIQQSPLLWLLLAETSQFLRPGLVGASFHIGDHLLTILSRPFVQIPLGPVRDVGSCMSLNGPIAKWPGDSEVWSRPTTRGDVSAEDISGDHFVGGDELI